MSKRDVSRGLKRETAELFLAVSSEKLPSSSGWAVLLARSGAMAAEVAAAATAAWPPVTNGGRPDGQPLRLRRLHAAMRPFRRPLAAFDWVKCRTGRCCGVAPQPIDRP